MYQKPNQNIIVFKSICQKIINVSFQRNFHFDYYAPPSRPEGPRRCISIFDVVMVTIYTGCVYLVGNSPGQIIYLAILGSCHSSVHWPFIFPFLYAMGLYTYQKIHVAKLRSCYSFARH